MQRGLTLWLGALLLALTFLAADTAARLRSITAINRLAASISTEPGGHELILPVQGADGYHWLMHAERMFGGDGFRIRFSHAENPPAGREVHWSGSLRWWLGAVALGYRAVHPELSVAQALARVAPWAGALLFGLFIAALTPLVAHRFGAAAGALFALGCVAVHPFYQYSAAGLLDHHGVAAMCALLLLFGLIAGGGGWVRADGTVAPAQLLPNAASARRWFITSAVAGGVGLWVSAATAAPVLVAAGGGALIAALWTRARAAAGQRFESSLWRLWGVVGCSTSMVLYLLEYFPQHLGVRLEVNHPLYALAWLGAGDLLHRITGSFVQNSGGGHLNRRMLLGDVALISAPPLVILFAGDVTFRISDPFLWALHRDYILEFRSLGAEFSQLNAAHAVQGTTTALPLLLLPIAAWLWSNLRARADLVRRVALAGLIAAALCYAHAFLFPVVAGVLQLAGALPRNAGQATLVVHLLTLVFDAALWWLLFRAPWRNALPQLDAPAQGLLLLAAVPALGLLLLAFWQIRWLGVASALLLVVLITLAALIASQSVFRWSTTRRAVAAFCLLWVLAPFPAFSALLTWRFGYPADIDRTQVVASEVAALLRTRLADRTGVVLSAPTSTTWLIHFGGLRGLGTLYWENLDGLRSSAAIYGAATDDAARALIDRHGVTHIVVFSWDSFVREYTALARGERATRNAASPLRDAFIVRLLQGRLPGWITPIEYTPPAVGLPADARVWIFEVDARAAAS